MWQKKKKKKKKKDYIGARRRLGLDFGREIRENQSLVKV
jgi:hypothetical protein